MIIGLLRKIEEHLAEIVRLLRTPEDFTREDATVQRLTKDVHDAEQRLPHPEQKGDT